MSDTDSGLLDSMSYVPERSSWSCLVLARTRTRYGAAVLAGPCGQRIYFKLVVLDD
jgi:hypothetical protein